MKQKLSLCGSLMVASLALFHAPDSAHAAAFTPGNIVVLQYGDGTGALGNFSTNIFILEFTPGGTPVQTIAIPTSGPSVMSGSGNTTSEGFLARSTNGSLL